MRYLCPWALTLLVFGCASTSSIGSLRSSSQGHRIVLITATDTTPGWMGDYVHVDMAAGLFELNEGPSFSRILKPSSSWTPPRPSSFWLWKGWVLGINEDYLNAMDFPPSFKVERFEVDALVYQTEGQEVLPSRSQRRGRMELVFEKEGNAILASVYRIMEAHEFHWKEDQKFFYPRPIYFGGRLKVEFLSSGGLRTLVMTDGESIVTNSQIDILAAPGQTVPPNGH